MKHSSRPSPPAAPLAEAVVRHIDRFHPKRIPPGNWAVIGPLVREAVAATAPATVDDATELSSRTAALFAWCVDQGYDPSLEVLLDPDTIDRFAAIGCADLAKGTRANYRRLLRKVGGAVLGPPAYPQRPTPFGTSDPRLPYSIAETRALAGWARGHSTARKRDGALALLGLCVGAGLRSIETLDVRVEDIVDEPDALFVEVSGKCARRVPVVAAWEWTLRAAVERAGQGFVFLPERETDRHRKLVSTFTENLPRGDAPKLGVERMRTTWIVRHLDARVPVGVVAAAAGVKPEELHRYAGMLTPTPDHEAVRLLRATES